MPYAIFILIFGHFFNLSVILTNNFFTKKATKSKQKAQNEIKRDKISKICLVTLQSALRTRVMV